MKYVVEDEEEMPRRQGLGRTTTREEAKSSGDAEITLGTRSLLGIFFGLVLICGIFFGLGYSVGRVTVAKGAGATASTDAGDTPADGSHLAKPSPQQGMVPAPAALDTTTAAATAPGATTLPGAAPAAGTPGTVTVPVGGTTTAAPTAASATTETQLGQTVFPSQGQASAATPVKTAITPAGTAFPTVQRVAENAPAAGTLMVQVAAVGVAQDAQILVGSLRQHGYSAVIRHEPTDALLHVQIGPFATKAQAEATRSRLLADGYNAVIK